MKFRTTLNHRLEVEGVRYAYVTSSASILRIDEVSDSILEAFSNPHGLEPGAWLQDADPESEQSDLKQTFEEMVLMGMVRPLGETPPPSPDLPPMPYPLATLVLNVTNKCNLSCTYCYEYGEDRIAEPTKDDGPPKASMMSPEVARKSIDFLFDSSGERRDLAITFFGGETLLGFTTIRETVLYAEERARESSRRVSFSLTTNATLLSDEVIDFLVEHRFGISISIDGSKEDHDRHRTFSSGRGSYDVIVPRIRKLIDKKGGQGRPLGARVTLTADMVAVRGLYRHLTEEIGFDEVGIAPVTSAPGRDYALSDENYRTILEEFRALADDLVARALENESHGFSNLNDLLRELYQGVNKAHPCGAGLGLLGVSTEGELGLCHRFVESGEHEVGNVATGIDQEKRSSFLKNGHISRKIACHECFAQPICSGGCYHEAYVRYADPAQPNLHYCDWIRAWTELGLESYARIMNGNPAFFDRFESGTKAEDRDPSNTPKTSLAPNGQLSPRGEAV